MKEILMSSSSFFSPQKWYRSSFDKAVIFFQKLDKIDRTADVSYKKDSIA